MAKAKRPQAFCIFCGGTGLTDEHVFSQWILDLIPKREDVHLKLAQTADLRGGTPKVTRNERLNPQGDIATRRSRSVCRNCNGGWMSRLEEEAKAALRGFITRDEFAFRAADQAAVLRWVITKTMIVERLSNSRARVFTPETIQAFYQNREPPAGTQIWLADYSGVAWYKFFRHNAVQTVAPKDAATYDPERPATVQLTMFIIGKFVAVCSHQNLPTLLPFEFPAGARRFLFKLHPRDPPGPDQMTESINDFEVEDILGYLAGAWRPKFETPCGAD